MVELLKQNVFQPMPFEKQVVIILAANDGALDDLPLKRLKDFEKEYLAFLDKNYADAIRDIQTTKALSNETKEKLKNAVAAFKATFK